jgi:hypothetical protein
MTRRTETGAPLSLRALNRATLARQGLLERRGAKPAAAIAQLAGLQAQYSPSPFIALWTRVRDFSIEDLNGALERREVVKASLMRNTLHLVAADELEVYDVAVAATRSPIWQGRARKLGIDWDALHDAALRYVEDQPRTLDEIRDFVVARVPGTKDRWEAWQLISSRGGLVHVPPSGTWRFHGAARYTSRRSWLQGGSDHPDEETALDAIVRRYVAAYGPIALSDLARWLGERRMPRLRASLNRLEPDLVHFRDDADRDVLDLRDAEWPAEDVPAPVRFLARWDSALIGYDRRARILPEPLVSAVVKKNADFLPTVLVDGFVAAVWRIEREKTRALLTIRALAPLAKDTRRDIEAEGDALLRFAEPDAGAYALGVELV